ncbi:MAG: hypothetical protein R3D25_22260 [Geminicoccaceae bacterium]
MGERTRVRINLAQAEIEVEGSESFVESFRPQLESLLDRLPREPAPAAPTATAPGPATPPAAPARAELGPFGEFLHHLPASATEVDRMLAAGYYLQQLSGDDSFATGDANKRLAEHGIKIGNPSQCVRQSLTARRVFSVARGRFRVSQTGRAYLRQLTNGAVPE